MAWAAPYQAEASAKDISLVADALREELVIGAYWNSAGTGDAEGIARLMLTRWRWFDPFDGAPSTALSAVRLAGFWRRQIIANRGIVAAVGFGSWKRDAITPLLWDGTTRLRYVRKARALASHQRVAIWRARASAGAVDGVAPDQIVEIEDGFIRSAGLGADCIPPLSIAVDRQGAHFDPSWPTDLEELINAGCPVPTLVERATALRQRIVAVGLGKYGVGGGDARLAPDPRRTILVPGQVEDDRSVRLGGGAIQRNIDLLRAARVAAPDARIVYKPHPDIEAGHRPGAIADTDALRLADIVVRDTPMSALIDAVDEVHVLTSLAGFEALLRGKSVTCHGTPFYAGWGLTRDLGFVPARRTARPSLDQLVATVLLAYPRYVDPATGLPCPAEVVVERLINPSAVGRRIDAGWLTPLRRAQGRLRRWIGGRA